MIDAVRTFAIVAVSGLLVSLGACAARTTRVADPASSQADAADRSAQIAQYVQAQEALAADEFGKAKDALTPLVGLVDPGTRPLVQAAVRARDIGAMRERFKPLSELLTLEAPPAGYAKAYCPMFQRGAPWIQRDGPIRNPYFGATMLTCGVIDAAPAAHMDHSSQHGGIVFMAPDGFHHIEGAYPTGDAFHVYVTDNYRKPVNVTGWAGRAVLEEVYDEAKDAFREVKAVPLTPSPDGAYLEAKVGGLNIPAEITAKVLFQEGFPEERFDFIFGEYSKVTPAAPVMGAPPAVVPLAERIRPEVPENPTDILTEIGKRDALIKDLIRRGSFMEIFIPALQAKELALALNTRSENLPARNRNTVQIAVRSLVRAAWLLDWYGDLGNKQQVNDAYDIFGSAVKQLSEAHGGNR
jgi:hypothetical protein